MLPVNICFCIYCANQVFKEGHMTPILFWFFDIIQPVTSLPAVIDYSLEVYPWLWVDIR